MNVSWAMIFMKTTIIMSSVISEEKSQYRIKDDLEETYSLTPKSLPFRKILNVIVIGALLNLLLAFLSNYQITNAHPYNGPLKPHLPIFSGEIHFARIPKEYWQHRILMLKSMGLNSLSVYVMWNFHQLERGVFDFEKGQRDLPGFLGLAKKHQMNVLLRPGPYVCAEWDFGGLPARLLGMKGMQIRSPNALYEAQVQLYITALAKVAKPFLQANGGSIIMVQIENELGYVQDNPRHTNNLLRMWQQEGIQSNFYYEDAEEVWRNNYWEGANIALSESSNMLKYLNLELSSSRGDSLIFGGEVYSGWFTDWGDGDWSGKSPQYFAGYIDNLLKHNRSVSIYMGYGGTNFATTAGANGLNEYYSYMPHITSYDYDSPISEEGKITQKYHLLRKVFQEYYGDSKKFIETPQAPKMIAVPNITLERKANLFGNLGQPVVKEGELTFFESDALKMYNQGIVLYQTILPTVGSYVFKATLRDYASVFIDQVFIQSFTRRYLESFKIKVNCEKAPCKMWVFVEAMGHINFGKHQGQDRKGMMDFVDVKERKRIYKWNIYTFSLDDKMLKWQGKSNSEYFSISRGTFSLKEVGDTFLDMRAFGKGYLWVNGRNLGRYWDIGPQYRLYCPGVWLKEGQNDVAVFQLGSKHGDIKGYVSMR